MLTFLLEFASFYEGEPCSSHLAALLTAESAKVLPQIREWTNGTLTTVVVY